MVKQPCGNAGLWSTALELALPEAAAQGMLWCSEQMQRCQLSVPMHWSQSRVLVQWCQSSLQPVSMKQQMTDSLSARLGCQGEAGAQCKVHVGLLQEHIESENARLEREQQFWAKEIVVKIEYKYCPNLTIIDTPGGPRAQEQPCAGMLLAVYE